MSKINSIFLGICSIIIGVITLVLALTSDDSLHNKAKNTFQSISFIISGVCFIYFGASKK